MKTNLFQSCGHYWVLQICWHIECSISIASPFRIWNSSVGISSPPLALFVVMLSKVYLTSHSRIFGSRWVMIPSLRSFLYSSVYSCHLFLISSASVMSIPCLSFSVLWLYGLCRQDKVISLLLNRLSRYLSFSPSSASVRLCDHFWAFECGQGVN